MRLSVLHVQGGYFAQGGAETYLRGLAAAQRAKGHRAAVLYSSERPPGHEAAPDELFCPPSFGLRSGLAQARAVLAAVRGWRPQLLHLHVTQYQVSPFIVRALARRWPTVQSVHDTLFLCLKGIDARTLEGSARILPQRAPCLGALGWGCLRAGCVSQLVSAQGVAATLHGAAAALYRARAQRAPARLLVNSRFSRDELLRNGIAESRVSVLGIAAPLPDAWQPGAGEAEESAEPPVIVFAGKLVEAKGVRLFLEALERLEQRRWQAVVIGDGPQRAALEEHVARRGWSGRLRLEPGLAREALAAFYRRARLAVFPSLWPESWGLAGIEAMWFARPVVAFDSGAVREWLEDGATGYVVPWGDAGKLASAIERLLLDRALARRMGQEARRRAERFFRLDEHVEGVLRVYREVLAAHG